MVENQVQNPPAEKVIALSASLLEPFQGHPFRVASGEEMEQLKESIRKYGVLSPLLVRPRGDGRYEIVSGHRRKAACEALGITELPVLVRDKKPFRSMILRSRSVSLVMSSVLMACR
ncbi:ParB/RepB/Spo0J family partition protein [Subdoligranulum sp. DSM 109015]|uniref:ParB/RepB/Spo0J family partition protein n=1 Tax=Gemmiger gallinarum TaxID=2779354 RepID=A0ABR9R5C1_9FIRM|nr:ParB/RepB/Spo0J family partition protein [Gemmiger gallinarum]